jgi:hypothetical protein
MSHYPSITTRYDNELCELESFRMRPFQLPHIGKLVGPGGVLFILESHYVDPRFFKYQYDPENLKLEAPDLFYNLLDRELTRDFTGYLNTRQVVKDAECSDWKIAKGKTVYRKLSSVVKEGLKLIDNGISPLEYIGIYNYFQRPSYKLASSIKVSEKDSKVAYATLVHFVNTVGFKKIIFTSAKGYDCFKREDDDNDQLIQLNAKV